MENDKVTVFCCACCSHPCFLINGETPECCVEDGGSAHWVEIDPAGEYIMSKVFQMFANHVVGREGCGNALETD